MNVGYYQNSLCSSKQCLPSSGKITWVSENKGQQDLLRPCKSLALAISCSTYMTQPRPLKQSATIPSSKLPERSKTVHRYLSLHRAPTGTILPSNLENSPFLSSRPNRPTMIPMISAGVSPEDPLSRDTSTRDATKTVYCISSCHGTWPWDLDSHSVTGFTCADS